MKLETTDPEISLEKCLGKVPPPYFVHDFSRKMFLMFYAII